MMYGLQVGFGGQSITHELANLRMLMLERRGDFIGITEHDTVVVLDAITAGRIFTGQ